jgi:hypothetical protein
MSEARGWRWPTGAGSGLERTTPGAVGAGLSSGGFCAQAVPATAAVRTAPTTAGTMTPGSMAPGTSALAPPPF